MQRVIVMDRQDRQLFELSPADLMALERRDELNGEHALEIGTTRVLEQGQRVLMEDGAGKLREYVVYGIDAAHERGDKPIGTYYCTWSIQPDLMGTRVSRMPGTENPVQAGAALEAALSGTSRWKRGNVTRTSSGGASMYDTDGWDALATLVETWGGELDARIAVDSSGAVSRFVDLLEQSGSAEPVRRFDYGADLKSVRRTVADGPLYCRITPRGKGEETEGGGYGRKITIESVNGGKDYLENPAMVDLAKLPDGNGGWEYPTLEIDNPDMEEPADLLAWARSVLQEYTLPRVTYQVDVLQLAREGVDLQGVALGDVVQVVDRKFDGLRLEGRVVALAVDELAGKTVSLTVGQLGQRLSDAFRALDSRVSKVTAAVQSINGGNLSTGDYVARLVDRLNAEINATGGYTYIVPGEGIRTYDKAVSDPSRGAEASKVVEVKGGSIRIADSRTAQGEWDWRTVFVSGHIAAELVTAANLTAGYIGSADSGNYWNLDTGELRMASTATIGGRTVAQLVNGVDATITDVDVQYAQGTSATQAPTSGWQTTAPQWREGYYIWQRTATTTAAGTSYSVPVMISGRDGMDGQDGTGVSILGSYDTVAQLRAAHPTGNEGDGYLVGGDLYVWDGSQWLDVGTIQGPQGQRGPQGDTGVGVSAITEQYYLSTSQSTQAGGSWSTAQPAWSSGRYIWTRSEVKWTDGRTTYTTPVLAKAINGANQTAKAAADDVDDLDKALDQRGVFNRLTNNGQTQGIYLQNGLVYINGEYIKADTVVTDRIMTSRSSNTYGRVGTTSAGLTGASFYNAGVNFLDLSSMYAVDDPTQATTGVGFSTRGRAIADSSTYYRHTVIVPPTGNQGAQAFMSRPAQQMCVSPSSTYLQHSDTRGLYFGSDYAILRLSNTTYIRLAADGIQCRCGQYGFGWYGGKFSEQLRW